MIIMENNKDTNDKHFVVIDHSGLMTTPLQKALETRNSVDIFHSHTGEKIDAAYVVEFMEPDIQSREAQQLALSDRVESQELHDFIEIGPDILHPAGEEKEAFLKYYSQHSFNDQIRYWFQNVTNNNLREIRAAELNLDEAQAEELLWCSYPEIHGDGVIDPRGGTAMVLYLYHPVYPDGWIRHGCSGHHL